MSGLGGMGWEAASSWVGLKRLGIWVGVGAADECTDELLREGDGRTTVSG